MAQMGPRALQVSVTHTRFSSYLLWGFLDSQRGYLLTGPTSEAMDSREVSSGREERRVVLGREGTCTGIIFMKD